MRNVRAAAALALFFMMPLAALADADTEVRALYRAFAEAQNARNIAGVRALLWDSPKFLWLSDGKAFWGPETLIERMSAYQKADLWEVKPDFTRARVVEVSPTSAFLYQPLKLTLGPREGANTIAFLVNVLCVKTSAGWRIAALFTTEENPN